MENSKQTFFVGGTVRDILLKRNVKDVDISTSIKPEVVAEILKKHYIDFNQTYKNLGIIIALKEQHAIAVATFRKEAYSKSRYPKITFIQEAKKDSERRDFTINSLYLSLKNGQILDFHNGLEDIKKKKICFIGDPKKRITDDPLRIVRALRFSLELNFKIENKSYLAIKNKFLTLGTLTKTKIFSEVEKLTNLSQRKILIKCLTNEKNLDKYFKSR
ncbi:MAG: CCA tRNA nucleotidyltransferase [Candidatus Doudnabacteria bacterium]|nr:CCA tRNA nucleotidyltransferase [Candidatus Doudnabacteria bacterium]